MFRSQHSIRDRFPAAEEHITLGALERDRFDTGRELANRHGIDYTTEFRLRVKLRRELVRASSLLVSRICVEDLNPPQDVADDEFQFLVWLLETCASREQKIR